jgi:hypothetical protein
VPRKPSNLQPIDWKLWGHPKSAAAVWLHEAAALSVGIAPEDVSVYSHRGLNSYDPILTGPGANAPEFAERWAEACRYLRRGVLRERVSLVEFAAWAIDAGLSLPAEFPKPAAKPAAASPPPAEAPKVLTTKERTSLLVIIGALAKKARVDLDKPSTSAKAIVAVLDEMGCKIGIRTVENALKDVPDALEKKGY